MYAPTHFKPTPNRACDLSKSFAQFGQSSGKTVYGINPRVSAISHLLRVCFPTTILFAVIAIVIFPAKRFSGWSLAHILEKIRKFHPSLAHLNASSSVKLIRPFFGIGTSLDHGYPRIVGFCLRMVACVSVGRNSLFKQFDFKTTARARFFRRKRFIRNLNLISTTASTVGIRTLSSVGINFVRRVRDYFKPSKSFSDIRYWCRHIIGSINVVLSGGCSATTGTRCAIFSNSHLEVNQYA